MTMREAEAEWYWKGVIATLKQRGLLRQYRKREDGSREQVVPQASYLSTEEWICFILDMQRLAGIPREALLEGALWKQIRATLGGRDTTVVDGAGLGILIAREPIERTRSRLPRRLQITPEEVPKGDYTALLGQSQSGPVRMDLAGGERAILVGGATGKGKTGTIRSLVLQLAHKHGPDELQLAIVDLKRLDFTALGQLPQLVRSVANEEAEAEDLVAWCVAEMERRQRLMQQVRVTRWDRLSEEERFPLLLLVVDEVADFEGSPLMHDLVRLARKGRASGVSLILATQRPDAEVLSRQVKANVATRVAFGVTDVYESRIILDRPGAERLRRPGLTLTNAGGRWRKVQAAYVEDDALGDWLTVELPGTALTDLEQALVRYAAEELGGEFVIGQLYEAQERGDLDAPERVSKYALTNLGQTWERRGWLTEPEHRADPRRVTDELARLAGCTLGEQDRDTVTRVTRRDRALHGSEDRDTDEIPPFLRERCYEHSKGGRT